jgi:hypothetical protein
VRKTDPADIGDHTNDVGDDAEGWVRGRRNMLGKKRENKVQ